MHEPHLPPDSPLPFQRPAYDQPAPIPLPFGIGTVVEATLEPEEPITLRGVARDVVRVLLYPRAEIERAVRPWAVWGRVIGLYLIGMMCAGIVASAGVKISGASNLIDEMQKNAHTLDGRLRLLLLAGAVAPLWEETAFRLPLARFHPARVLPSLALLALLLGSSIPSQARLLWAVPLAVAALVVLPTIFSQPHRAAVSRWWDGHFRWVLALSILTFGLAHAGNYRFPAHSPALLWVVPLLVAPQLVAGALLAYTRQKLGFWFGVLLHSSVNTSLVLLTLAVPDAARAPRPSARPTPASRTRRHQALPVRTHARPAKDASISA